MSKPPASEQVQVNFRMPVDLRDRIKVAAETNNRSMNAEIVDVLAKKFPAIDPFKEALAEALTFIESLSRSDREAFINAIDDRIDERVPNADHRTREMLRTIYSVMVTTANRTEKLLENRVVINGVPMVLEFPELPEGRSWLLPLEWKKVGEKTGDE